MEKMPFHESDEIRDVHAVIVAAASGTATGTDWRQ